MLEVDVEVFALGGGEVAQDEIRRVHPARRPADAESNAQILLRAKGRRDRSQTVVPTLAAAGLHPDGGRRQVEFVVHRNDVVRFNAEEPGQRRGRGTRKVHVRPRFGQHHARIGITGFDDVGAGPVVLERTVDPAREHVDHHGARVVPIAGVLLPGIAQTDDEERLGRHDQPSVSVFSSRTTPASASASSVSASTSSAVGASCTATTRASGSVTRTAPSGSVTSPARNWVPASAPSMSTVRLSGMLIASTSTDRVLASVSTSVPGPASPVTMTWMSTVTFSPRRISKRSTCST